MRGNKMPKQISCSDTEPTLKINQYLRAYIWGQWKIVHSNWLWVKINKKS